MLDKLNIRIRLDIKWYEALLVGVTVGLLGFGLWALIDTLLIGSPVAAWRFLALFVIWSLPGVAILTFVRPRPVAPEQQS